MEDDLLNPPTKYKSVAGIANISDHEIMNVVYDVALEYDIPLEHAAILYVIRTAQAVQLEGVESCDKYVFKTRIELNASQRIYAAEQYPEISIVFDKGSVHDHPLPALFRAIDTYRINKKAGYQIITVNVGGNPIAYKKKENHKQALLLSDIRC